MDGKKCSFIKPNGEQCEAYSLTNSPFCFVHAPELEGKRDLARRLGGRHKEEIAGIPLKIASAEDVLDLLSLAVGELVAMPATVAQAKAIVNAASALLDTLEMVEFERKLDELEAEQKYETKK